MYLRPYPANSMKLGKPVSTEQTSKMRPKSLAAKYVQAFVTVELCPRHYLLGHKNTTGCSEKMKKGRKKNKQDKKGTRKINNGRNINEKSKPIPSLQVREGINTFIYLSLSC